MKYATNSMFRDNRMDQRGGRDDRRSGGGGGRDSRGGGGGRRPPIDTAPALGEEPFRILYELAYVRAFSKPQRCLFVVGVALV